MTRRPSVYDLLQAKGTTKWVQLHVDDAAEAAAAVEAGDWIEFQMLGAYSCSLRTAFNGFYPDTFVGIGSPTGGFSSSINPD